MEKVKVNKEQLKALESMVVAYMVSAKNEIGLSDSEKNTVLLNLDKTWDSIFEVS
ncbi:hypothetical protein VPHK165_0096 [Vibrio phage K165]|nr:hypothetical protein MYOV022v2_p0076 [Vibrio phage 12E28.1]QZI90245.1 hypothetical protein MYOV021v2_p0076 [Vibrio phage 18E29.1]QZI90611.1 hypothetical protein MYOV023v1_p0064 [Vibrio phage 91E28.1a]QZI90640.1 hypothetical protein MYOV020v1_p0014 [Vibrio phage 98E28.6a]